MACMNTVSNKSKPTSPPNPPHHKRKSESEEMTPKKAKVTYASGKNPVQLLHEKFSPIEYKFTQEGSPHDPKFTVTTTLNGRTFFGAGASKQKAKFELAVVVLKTLGFASQLGEPVYEDPPLQSGSLKSPNLWPYSPNSLQNHSRKVEDFSSDIDYSWNHQMPGRDREERQLYAPPASRNPNYHDPSRNTNSHDPWGQRFILPPGGYDRGLNRSHILSPPQAVEKKFSKLFTNRPPVNLEKARLYPVMVLTELFPSLKPEWVEGSGRGDRQFKVEADVQGRRFFGEGRSKKIAKLNLAKTVLLCMYDIHDFKDDDTTSKSPKTEVTQLEKKFPLTQLKELVGDDLKIDVALVEEGAEDEKQYHATIVAKGVAYEGVGKQKNVAKLKAAKRALDCLRPKRSSQGGGTESVENHVDVHITGTSPASVKKEIDTGRHPTMVFCELYRQVQFECTETKGNSGLNEYILEATVEGKHFSAKAFSKKKAKLRLVLTAFEELKGISKDSWSSIDVTEAIEDRVLSSNPATSPIVLLLKLKPEASFEIFEDTESDDVTTKFKAVVRVGDREFFSEGQNKKTAKTAVARIALTTLFGIDADNYVEETRNDIFVDNSPKSEIPVELSNAISDAVQQKFAEIFQGETQYKVLAGFVIAQYGNDGNNEEPILEVVSLGTGTKCITGDQIDNKGQTLNDCHGEIIACRGFRRYMYSELLKALDRQPNTIFEQSKSGKYSIKSCYRVYLYVNTAPCGDGRVFTLQSQQQGAKNKTAGLLRTKIENGQGTIPVPENNIQTSDGILEGERLRTMSCSDKILKWNTLGVQGALLSCFIDPVYLEGIVIGLHFNYDALNRALYVRASKIENCPPYFRVHKPKLGCPNNLEKSRDTSKATSNSFNWYFMQPTMEAVNASTGKTVICTPSRLCKLNFFDKFMQAIKIKRLASVNVQTYHDAKASAKEYQQMKEKLFSCLEETTCGKWIGKPYEHDRFGY